MSAVQSLQSALQNQGEFGLALPLSAFRDASVYELEQANVFQSDWVFVCAAQELREVGEYFAFSLAGEPVVLIRGQDGELRALSNVCRHRGSLLVEPGFGNAKRFVCPFHAWTYEDTGAFRGAPHTGQAVVEKDQHCLPQFALEEWQGLVFINLDGTAPPLWSRFVGLEAELEDMNLSQWHSAYRGVDSGIWQSNWKSAFENAIEGYHLFKVHPETIEPFNPTKSFRYRAGSTHWSTLDNEMKIQGMPVPQILVSLPPSFVALITPYSFDWLSVFPIGPEQCHVRTAGMTQDEKMREAQGQGREFTETFVDEDKVLCERNHAATYAQFGKAGGQLVEMEGALRDFHHYLSERLA